MARPKKIKNESIGRAERIAIKHEEAEREIRKWQRKRETIKKFAGEK